MKEYCHIQEWAVQEDHGAFRYISGPEMFVIDPGESPVPQNLEAHYELRTFSSCAAKATGIRGAVAIS
jgi:hypothetical protein